MLYALNESDSVGIGLLSAMNWVEGTGYGCTQESPGQIGWAFSWEISTIFEMTVGYLIQAWDGYREGLWRDRAIPFHILVFAMVCI